MGYLMGQLVDNAFMTVDACFARVKSMDMLRHAAISLTDIVHGVGVVATSAFSGVGFLHTLPDPFSQLKTPGLEFLLGVDGAQEVMVYVVGCLDFPYQFREPFPGNVAIRTSGAYAGAIAVMTAFQILHVNGLAQLVAGDAKFFSIGYLDSGVEATPENSTHDDTNNEYGQAFMAPFRFYVSLFSGEGGIVVIVCVGHLFSLRF